MSKNYAWFDPTPAYEGPGTEETHGTAEKRPGYFRVEFDEAGLPDPPFGIGMKSLTLMTEHGMFSMNCQSRNHIPDAQFESSIDTPAQYWVLPLVNFISRFQDDRAIFDEHPMRLHSATNHFKAARARLAPFRIPVWSNVIGFSFTNEPAFIESLPDYATWQNRLEQGTDDVLITALMVGRVPASARVDLVGLDEWFPYDLLSLLSLSTNRLVGAPWIEFRTASGRLVKRIHRQLNVETYMVGRSLQTIPNVSLLLSDALTSPSFGDRVLSVACRRLVRSLVHPMTVDDRFNHLCRTVESLYRIYPPDDRKQRNPSEVLSDTNRHLVREILTDSAQRIRERAHSASQEGELLRARALERLGNRVETVPRWAPDLRDKLADMLREAGFADAEVAGRCFSADEEEGRKIWFDEIYRRRNTTAHEASFTFSGSIEQPLETDHLADHVHDISFRLILKLYVYRGQYRPFVTHKDSVIPSYCPIDWVHSGRQPEHLGYAPAEANRGIQ